MAVWGAARGLEEVADGSTAWGERDRQAGQCGGQQVWQWGAWVLDGDQSASFVGVPRQALAQCVHRVGVHGPWQGGGGGEERAVPAAGVVAEAMVALVLAEAVLEKFGGDSVGETKRNFESYLANLSIK